MKKEYIHVYPEEQASLHNLEQGIECRCGPEVEEYVYGIVVIHRRIEVEKRLPA